MSASYVDREKQLRSVFVGNIPFDVTEGDLREKFEQAGPIVSFRLVHDRDSGKPKGYGFIEYQDAATANSCVRNLNNVEYNGRPLRVGPAAGGDQASADNIKALQQALGGLQQESPYGAPVEPAEAPEAISKAVSSLPPEQMFELMKQMKLCIQNNPNEARTMLLQNPQLAYALLQAQIVMKIVDPQVAMALLHRERDTAPALNNEEPPKSVVPGPSPVSATAGGFRGSGGLLGERPGEGTSNTGRSGLLDNHMLSPTNPQDRWSGSGGSGTLPGLDPRNAQGMRGPDPSPSHRGMDPRGGPSGMDPRGGSSGMDPRGGPSGMDPRGGSSGMDPRGGPSGMDPRGGSSGMDPRGVPSLMDPRAAPSVMDPRSGARGMDPRRDAPGLETRSGPGIDPRRESQGLDPRREPQGMDPRREQHGLDPRRDPRGHPMDTRGPPMDRRDPGARSQDMDFRNADRGRPSAEFSRGGGLLDPPRDIRAPPGRGGPPPSSQFSPRQGGPSSGAPSAAGTDEDKEKAALIMQVLQLTDDQIQQLPPDQRQSILILKQQISRQQ